jgi:hypothetical protein
MNVRARQPFPDVGSAGPQERLVFWTSYLVDETPPNALYLLRLAQLLPQQVT